MRGFWYVFSSLDGEGLYQCVADQVMEVMHGTGGWLVCFRCPVPNKFLSRKKYAPPYLGKRVRF